MERGRQKYAKGESEMNDKKQGSDVPGELPDVGFVPVHKLDPCDTSHLSDPRRKRSLEGPTTEVRDGGYPTKYVKKPTG